MHTVVRSTDIAGGNPRATSKIGNAPPRTLAEHLLCAALSRSMSVPFSSKLGDGCVVVLCLVVWGLVLPLSPDTPQAHPALAATPGEPPPPLFPPSPQATHIAVVLRRVVSRMHHHGLTAANVATRQPETYTPPLVRVDVLGRLHTAIQVSTFDPQVEAALVAQHVQLDRVDISARVVQAWVPFDRLESVAALSFVCSIRPPRYAQRR